MIKGPLTTLDEGSAGSELYIIRRKGTAGVTHALRRKIESDENIVCLYLFATQLGAFKFLNFMGLDSDQWEFAGSEEFGGVVPLLKKASKLSTFTPTHVLINPPMEHGPLAMTPTIEDAIDYFESLPAEESNSGGPGTPFWVLARRGPNGREVFFVGTEPGVMAVYLFKTEMDAEEFRHSWLDPDTWESERFVNLGHAIAALEEMTSQGCTHAVINPPPSDTIPLETVPIEDIIGHVEYKGHIRDLY